MAKHVKPLQIGIDVSKSELWIQQTDGDSPSGASGCC